MRKLASIQKIISTSPIKDADRIEIVHVLGWQCVSGKGEFKPGELVVYFEIDSFLPVKEVFEFLRKSCYRQNEFMGEGFKLKTMKFRGEISQGLCLGLDKFPEIIDPQEGMDVTELLGIKKWEMPERAGISGTIIGDRPYFIPLTDEMRIQSEPQLLQEFANLPYYITTKLDGSSHSVGYKDGEFFYAGRNSLLKDDGQSSFIEYIKKNHINEKMQAFATAHQIKTLVLQGEWCGHGIQKNRLKLKEPTWFVFTVKIDDKRANLNLTKEVCSSIGATMVPIEETGDNLLDKYPDEQALLVRAEGTGYNNTPREGIVIRPQEPVFSPTLQTSLSLKVLNNKYLLKNED